MAKGNTGGKLNVSMSAGGANVGGLNIAAQAAQQQPQPQPQQQVQNATPNPGSGIDNFMNMTDQQKADAVNQAIRTATFSINGDKAPNTIMQKLAHNLGVDSAPKLMTDAELDKAKGTDIYRGFSSISQAASDAITANVMMDSETFYSDTGGSAFGRGVYFMGNGNNRNEAEVLSKDVRLYGGSKNSNIVRAKLNDKANVISFDALSSLVSREVSSGSAFGNSLRGLDRGDRLSIVAMSKGYNVIVNKTGFNNGVTVVLDRSALNMSYTYHRVTQNDMQSANKSSLKWKNMEK